MIGRGILVAAALFATLLPAHAAGTRVWREAPADLGRGRADGVALSSAGKLSLAPPLDRFGGQDGQPAPSHVWALAAGPGGSLYLGTGPDGEIIEVDRSGNRRVFATLDEPMVTALVMAGDGRLLAAGSPGGTIYALDRAGAAEVWCETGEEYVWALVAGPGGKIYAGTGERGTILAIDSRGVAKPFFDGNEAHIVSLLALDDGWVAGGAGRGLVYRIDTEGHATVLHDGDLAEAVALHREPDGTVIAAFVAPLRAASPRPAVSIRLPDGVQVGTTDETVGALDEKSGPTLRGTIEGLPEAAAVDEREMRGQVVRIRLDGRVDELWSSSREAPFCLAGDGAGGVIFGTGAPARLYRIAAGGDVARLATLREGQATRLLSAADRRLFLATSNPGAIYSIGGRASEGGTFVSRAFDAGGPARWSAIRWNRTGGAGRTELYTRTGNSAEPDATWSAWSPALTDAAGSPIVNPDGRFAQWRMRQTASSGQAAAVSDVTLAYEPYNRAPRALELKIDPPGGAASGDVRIDWAATDPDGDALELLLEQRAAGAADWTEAGATPGLVQIGTRAEGRLDWGTSGMAEGRYQVRAFVSDQPSNAPGEGERAAFEPWRDVIVDRTAPTIDIRRAAPGTVEVVVQDAHSTVERLEVHSGGRRRFTPRPADGACDAARETFRFDVPQETGWTVRGVDAAGNAVERSLDAPAKDDAE